MKNAYLLMAAFALFGAGLTAQATDKPGVYEGKLESIEGRKVRIALPKETGEFTLADDVSLTFNAKKVTLADFKPGYRVSVLASQGGIVHQAKIVSKSAGAAGKATAGKPAAGKSAAGGNTLWGTTSKNGKDRLWRGEIVMVNEKDQLIRIKKVGGQDNRNDTTNFKADAETRVFREGKKGAFSDLKVGQTVEAAAGGGKTYQIDIQK